MALTKPQQLWVDALRSGKYGQTHDQLQGADGFCCLGVACMVAKENGVNVEIETFNLTPEDTIDLVKGTSLEVQPDVATWLNIKMVFGEYVDEEGRARSLASHNDDDGLNFHQIADIIEKNADSIFKN